MASASSMSGMVSMARRSGSGVEQGFDPRPMPFCELPFGESVAAAVFGAVGEVGAVGADGGGDVSGSIGFLCGLAGEDDAAVQEFRGGGAVDAAVGEAVVGGLVAGGGGEVGAGVEEASMDGADGVGVVVQQARGPEVVGEVVAVCLEVGRQPAVGDERGGGEGERHGVSLGSMWYRIPISESEPSGPRVR